MGKKDFGSRKYCVYYLGALGRVLNSPTSHQSQPFTRETWEEFPWGVCYPSGPELDSDLGGPLLWKCSAPAREQRFLICRKTKVGFE